MIWLSYKRIPCLLSTKKMLKSFTLINKLEFLTTKNSAALKHDNPASRIKIIE